MRVLFDAYWWVEGPFSNRTVQREIVMAWVRDHPEDDVTLMVPSAHGARARADAPPGVRVVTTPLRPHGVAAALDGARWGRRLRADLVLTHNFAPIVGRSAVFVHDVLFQTDPQWFTRPERLYFAGMPRLAPRAEVVLTSSATEAARIRQANPRLRRVVPVGLAVRTQLATAVPTRPAGLPDAEDFLLTVGRLNVRKNLATTMEAALRSGVVDASRPLVVVGEADGRTAPLPAAVRAAVDDGRVRMLGTTSDAELAWLYRHARLLVFLSLDEGFGLTPLEAATFGCPLVLSDMPVFRETTAHLLRAEDGAVRLVDPRDVDRAAAAIAAAVTDGRGAIGVAEDVSWTTVVSRVRDAVRAGRDGDRQGGRGSGTGVP